MILSTNMFQMLQEVLKIEPLKNAVPLDVPSEQLGDQLIKLYYRAEKQRSRALIEEIMQEAGDNWLNKLLNQSLSEPAEIYTAQKVNSLDDFMILLGENDDYERSIQF